MKIRTIVLSALFVLLLASMVSAAGIPLTIDEVKVNGDVVSAGGPNSLSVTRDQDVVVKVKVSATEDLEDVEITAFMGGYEYSRYEPISDTVGPFSMDANTTKSQYLNLRLPFRVEEDTYFLRVIVYDRNNNEMIQNYQIKVDTDRHRLIIRDVVISPSDGRVQAGRALLATVRVQNIGEKDEEQVKIRVAIPELGVSATDYIDQLDADESTTSEELYMRIPQCARAGEYTMEVNIEYDEYFAVVADQRVVEVLNPCDCSIPDKTVVTTTTEPSAYETEYACTDCPNLGCAGTTGPVGGSGTTAPEKTVITVGPETQEIKAGSSVQYLLSLNNQGSTSKTYVIGIEGASEWADVRVSPSNVVIVGPGETKAAYVHVAAHDDADGSKMFTVSVKADDRALKEVVLRASVEGDKKGTSTGNFQLTNGLEIGFFVLLALLVILALVIVFSKLKGPDKDEPEEESQTYY